MNQFLASLDNSNLLIISVILMLIPPIMAIISWWTLYRYKSVKADAKFANKITIITLLTFQIVQIIFSILSLLAYLGLLVSNDPDLSLTLVIVFIVISAVFASAWFLMIMLFASYIWFYIDVKGDKLVTIGESIKLSKIKKIIEDDEKNAVYINYLSGPRNLKRIKFSKSTTIGIFFAENASLTGVDLEKGDQLAYFKKEVALIREQILDANKKAAAKRLDDSKKEASPKKEAEAPKKETDSKKEAVSKKEAEAPKKED